MTPTNKAIALGSVAGAVMVAFDALKRAEDLARAASSRGFEIEAASIKDAKDRVGALSKTLETAAAEL